MELISKFRIIFVVQSIIGNITATPSKYDNSVALTILRLVETTCQMVLCIVIQVKLTVKINNEEVTITL